MDFKLKNMSIFFNTNCRFMENCTDFAGGKKKATKNAIDGYMQIVKKKDLYYFDNNFYLWVL